MTRDLQSLYIDTASRAGKILAESNAEAYRVEDTIGYILNCSEISDSEVTVIGTAILTTIAKEDDEPITRTVRIAKRSTNLHRITRVNEISRLLVAGDITIQEASRQLKALEEGSLYSRPFQFLSEYLFVAFYVVILFGGWMEVLTSFAVTTAVILVEQFAANRAIKNTVKNFMLTFTIAFVSTLLLGHQSIPGSTSIVIIASIMPIVPGTALTNGVRDIFQGDYLTGMSRIAEAITTAVFIAMGIGIGLVLGRGVIGWV